MKQYLRQIVLFILFAAACVCGHRCTAEAAVYPPVVKDLLPSARLAMRGYMIRSVAPIPHHPEMIRANYYSKVLPEPMLNDDRWDWGDCGARAVQAWLYIREMTADMVSGADIEQGEIRSLLHILSPDTGMPFVPELSKAAEGSYYYEMWDQGRTLRALITMWKTEADKSRKQALKNRIDKMISGLSMTATRGSDSKVGDYAIYPPEGGLNRPRNTCPLPGGGQLIEPLAEYWVAAGSDTTKQFLHELTVGIMSGREGRDSVFNEDGSFYGHFHGHAATALGIGRFGKALYVRGQKTEGLKLLQWSKKVYDWIVSPANVHGGSSWGWFPENTAYDNQNVKEYAEVCCVADMVEYAAFLAGCSDLDPALRKWDSLWDHVERYTLNSILPTQFKIDDNYRAALAASAASRRIMNGYVAFEQDNHGCFSHETQGHQTLITESGTRISQLLYGVAYDNKKASFRYHTGGQITSECFVTGTASSDQQTLRSLVYTEDKSLSIETSTQCGQGPYIVRTTKITNIGDSPLRDVRLSYTINLDTHHYEDDTASISDARKFIVCSEDGADWAGITAQPNADYLSVGDILALLGNDGLDWNTANGSFRGNAGVRLGWRLSDFAAGETKTVTLTLAAASTEDDTSRSLEHHSFPVRPVPACSLEDDLRVAERLVGGWVALFMPGELFCRNSGGGIEMYTGGCCSYSGPRALYACWKPTLADYDGTARIRMPISRNSPVLKQCVTEESGMVFQRIVMNQPRTLKVRIPDWANIGAVRVTDLKGATRRFSVRGRWLNLGRVHANETLVVTYPLVIRKTTESVGGAGKSMGFSPVNEQRTYTVTYCGNRVVGIKPGSELLPVFPANK